MRVSTREFVDSVFAVSPLACTLLLLGSVAVRLLPKSFTNWLFMPDVRLKVSHDCGIYWFMVWHSLFPQCVFAFGLPPMHSMGTSLPMLYYCPGAPRRTTFLEHVDALNGTASV